MRKLINIDLAWFGVETYFVSFYCFVVEFCLIVCFEIILVNS